MWATTSSISNFSTSRPTRRLVQSLIGSQREIDGVSTSCGNSGGGFIAGESCEPFLTAAPMLINRTGEGAQEGTGRWLIYPRAIPNAHSSSKLPTYRIKPNTG